MGMAATGGSHGKPHWSARIHIHATRRRSGVIRCRADPRSAVGEAADYQVVRLWHTCDPTRHWCSLCAKTSHSGPQSSLRLSFQQLPEAEVVALELRILHLAVAAEIDPVEAIAEPLDITVRELRSELRKHRLLQFKSFVGEVAAMMVVVNHHQ